MRYRKKDLIQMIAILEETNQRTKTADTDMLELMRNEFIECQSIAIDLGTYLETLDIDTRPIVELLEDYCETLYQQSEHINDASSCRKLCKKINKLLNQVKNAIKYDLPAGKKEIIFLPYKAAMWDSLESIWQAARKDESCNAYVIPIPYFDKSADGSLGAMHDEREAYPDYVPVISWNEYHIEEHRPDIAYVHNPYDDWNYVTSIHPDFFATRLKKNVGRLVYIPYFTAAKNRVDSHLCVLPVTILADKVIVQSEPVRQVYINELKKAEKENRIIKVKNIDERIIALGSPKYDKARSFSSVKNESIPPEWVNLIYKANGHRKNVVFYNASLAVLLRENDKVILKMERVFRIFQNIREDVVLLWRPHPLFLTTLQSMRPDLESKYRKLIEMYNKMHWGIFDDSDQFARAVHVSDFCYGDPSSVVDVFQATGKGVMIQDTSSNDEELFLQNKMTLSPQKVFCCDENENLYFFSENMLYCTDPISRRTEFLFDFNKIFDGQNEVSQISQMAVISNNIYFFARNNDICGVIIYDRFENSYQIIDIDFEKTCEKNDASSGLSYCVVFENQLCFVPSHSGKSLVKILLADHTVRYMEGWDMALESKAGKERATKNLYKYGPPILKDDKIIMPVAFQAFFVEYSFSNDQIFVITLKNMPHGISTIYGGKMGLWLASCDGTVLMRQTTQKLEIICLEKMRSKLPKNVPYSCNAFCFCMNGYIWVLHRYSDEIAKIDIDNYSVAYIPTSIREYPYGKRKELHFFMALQHHDDIFAFHGKGNVMLRLNTITERIEYFPLDVPMKPASDEWIQFIKANYTDIRLFQDKKELIQDERYGTIGEKIHKYIIESEEV